jgi:hypothetical protein
MATYGGCSVACDVRLVQDDLTKQKELVPLTIIRIVLDEDEDAIFQCTPEQLKHLMDRLKEATEELSLLTEKLQGINFST